MDGDKLKNVSLLWTYHSTLTEQAYRIFKHHKKDINNEYGALTICEAHCFFLNNFFDIFKRNNQPEIDILMIGSEFLAAIMKDYDNSISNTDLHTDMNNKISSYDKCASLIEFIDLFWENLSLSWGNKMEIKYDRMLPRTNEYIEQKKGFIKDILKLINIYMPLFDSASNKGTPFLEMDFNVIESELSSTFKKASL
ncbi:MAG: hypothetical protein H6586_07075 [Flavobacteriales bacterium]|nr:hypothetical protein [Flavobacteriales bacterium]